MCGTTSEHGTAFQITVDLPRNSSLLVGPGCHRLIGWNQVSLRPFRMLVGRAVPDGSAFDVAQRSPLS